MSLACTDDEFTTANAFIGNEAINFFEQIIRDMNSEEKSLRAFFIADFNVLPDLPSLFPIRELPRSFVYMGPVTWKGAAKLLDPTVMIDPNKPLVYVTMGSSGNREHMKTIAERLRVSQFQVVMTTGGVIDAQEMKSYLRPGFYVRDFLPGDKVIASSKQTLELLPKHNNGLRKIKGEVSCVRWFIGESLHFRARTSCAFFMHGWNQKRVDDEK